VTWIGGMIVDFGRFVTISPPYDPIPRQLFPLTVA